MILICCILAINKEENQEPKGSYLLIINNLIDEDGSILELIGCLKVAYKPFKSSYLLQFRYSKVQRGPQMHEKQSSPLVYMTSERWQVLIQKAGPYLKQLSHEDHLERISRLGLLSIIKEDCIKHSAGSSFYNSKQHNFCLYVYVSVKKCSKVEGEIGLQRNVFVVSTQDLLVILPGLDDYFSLQRKKFAQYGSYSQIKKKEIRLAFENYSFMNSQQRSFRKMLSTYIMAELNTKKQPLTLSELSTQEFFHLKEERQKNQAEIDDYIQTMQFKSSKKLENPQEIPIQQVKMQLEKSFYQNIQDQIQKILCLFSLTKRNPSEKQGLLKQVNENIRRYRLYTYMSNLLTVTMPNTNPTLLNTNPTLPRSRLSLNNYMKLYIRQILAQFKQIYLKKKQNDPMLQHFLEIYYKIDQSNMKITVKLILIEKFEKIRQKLWIRLFEEAFERMFLPYFQICTSLMKFENNTYQFNIQIFEIMYLLLDVYEIISSDCFKRQVLELLYIFYSKNIQHMTSLIKEIRFEKVDDCNFDKIRPLFQMYAEVIKLKQENYITALEGLKKACQQKLQTAVDFIQHAKKIRGHVKKELGQFIVEFIKSKEDDNFGLVASLNE